MHSDELRIGHLLHLGRTQEAADLAVESLSKDPDNAGLHSLHAQTLSAKGDDSAALHAADRGLALDPSRVDLHTQRSLQLSRLKRHREAQQSLDAALSIDPLDQRALAVGVESIMRETGRMRKPKKARAALAYEYADRLVRNYPAEALSHLMMSKARIAQGEYVLGATAARQALKLEPNNPIGHQLVGICQELNGNTRSAGDSYVNAAKLDPTSSTSIESLRRLGKHAALPSMFGLYWLFRLVIKGAIFGSNSAGSTVVTVLIVVAVVAVLGVAVFIRWGTTKEGPGGMSDLSPQARSILEQDKKFR